MISKLVPPICAEGGNVAIFVNTSGKIEIAPKKIAPINVKRYKIFVTYCSVDLPGRIPGTYPFCFSNSQPFVQDLLE